MTLDAIRIAEPCHEDWDAMAGDARARHCARCDLHVTDLSALTRAEAEAVLSQRTPGGRLCVRYAVDASGALVTRTSERERLVALLRALPGRADA
jgi:hypothetical protein